MITNGKHAEGFIQRFDSRLPRIVAMLGIILMTGVAASAQQAASAGGAKGPAQSLVEGTEVDVKVYVAGTPEDPYILARIGDFPEDLGEAGQEFLKREFIEHFIRDVMGLGARGRAEALKIALLPQEDAREQECSFNAGEVSGRITVRLAPRHVFVLVSLEHKEQTVPTLRT